MSSFAKGAKKMRNNYDAYLFKVLNLFTKKELTAQMLLEIEPDVSVERCKLRKTKFHEKTEKEKTEDE